MSTVKSVIAAVDSDERWMFRAGGISALAIGFGYLLIMGLFIPMGAPPSGAEAWLQYIAGNTGLWWAILGLSVLTDFLFLPVAIALYLALKQVNRSAMLLAAAGMILFVVLDLGITWINYAMLISLSSGFTSAADEGQRAALVAAAQYPSMVVDSSLLFVYNTLTLSVGILIASLVMRKGVFNKFTAYTGLATGILGVIAVAGSFFTNVLDITTILASVLTLLWALFAGYGLLQLSR